MVIRMAKFEMPKRLSVDPETEQDTYARFIAEPFERGYGHTMGNALRRVLLSSIEGTAITTVKIAGVLHEFDTIEGVVEDVTEIVLNLKKVLLVSHSREPKTIGIKTEKMGEITAGDIVTDGTVEVVNPSHHIATLNKKLSFGAELTVEIGRGYRPAEGNKREGQPIGIIPIDSIFTPVTRVAYHVEDTRVGRITDYDKLILEIWTDGRVKPVDALIHAASILREHLTVFVDYTAHPVRMEDEEQQQKERVEEFELDRKLNTPITEIELSVRAANCINAAGIKTIRDLTQKSEAEMLKYRNFGKKSLAEIKNKLGEMGLSLGMDFAAKKELPE
ncbi:MAG TPA: DNA-directed RNA polymerase subunit alpha [bacterium]|nr:DNA-directed RNA polymerase subunit alpha [Chlamydiota bacterium]HOE27999.1 DNA-directed RNA polymerase subunit alpha [bacterium]HQM51797.1 DNA-directed RNA polymerase subunit alpha [bacterium]